MIIAIKGRNKYNDHRVEPYYQGYRKQYIIKFSSSYDFLKWESTVIKPLLNNKYLIEITETEWVRDLDRLITRLEDYIEHPYIDILWYPGEARIENHVTKINLLNLSKTYKEDIIYTVKKDFPVAENEVIEHLLTNINYRWTSYEVYKNILKEKFGENLTISNIDKIVEKDNAKSATEIYRAILLKERFSIHNYKRLQKRYSRRWVKSYLIKETNNILKLKLELINRSKSLTDIRKNKKTSKYYYILNRISIPHLQIFRILLEEPLGVEIWLNNEPKQIYEDYLKEIIKEGMI